MTHRTRIGEPHVPPSNSPIARKDSASISRMYVFRGETGTAFVINVCPSIAGDIPIPGYHPEGRYEFKIDLNDDAIEELTYRITFDQRDLAGKQRFVLRRITGADAAEPNAAGTVVRKAPPARQSRLRPACISGRAKPAIHFGSSRTWPAQ